MTDYGNLPTQPLRPVSIPRDTAVALPTRSPRSESSAGGVLARAGGHVAVANVVSRVTGFAQTIVLAALLGTAAVGDAYNGANYLPNMVYELVLGSVLASAVVPLLARARRGGRKHSREFTQRVMLAAGLGLGLVTVLTVLASPLIVHIFVADATQRRLTTRFAYLLLPEIFFYGLTVLLTAVLNVRDRFAAAAWAPVFNNIIVMLTCTVFVMLPGPVTLTPTSMTTPQVLTLGLGTTAGIVGQAAWVVSALRRTGFRWSWRVRPLPYTWRPVRVGAPLLAWILTYAAISQVGVAVTMRVAFGHDGVSVYTNADRLFQAPYGILAASLLTILMPRISRSAAAGDTSAVIADLGRGARYLTVAMIPASMAMALLGPMLTALIFTGRVQPEGAHLIGDAVTFSAFGLAPFALVMLQMRVFYATNDTRTPAIINIAMVTTKIAVLALSAAFLPSHEVVVMLSVAASMSYVVGAAAGHLLLRRRYGLLGFSAVADTLTRVVWATAFAAVGCIVAMAATYHVINEPTAAHLITLAAGLLIGAGAFLLAAKAIGIPEVRNVRELLAS